MKIFIPLLIVLTAVSLYLLNKEEPKEAKEEWCEVGKINKDGSVSFTGKSDQEVVVFATVNGPKVMAKCTTQQ